METYLKSKPKDYGHLVGRIGVRENRENRGQEPFSAWGE
jgi:hypothetical protein